MFFVKEIFDVSAHFYKCYFLCVNCKYSSHFQCTGFFLTEKYSSLFPRTFQAACLDFNLKLFFAFSADFLSCVFGF